jgi:hypothetical protein
LEPPPTQATIARAGGRVPSEASLLSPLSSLLSRPPHLLRHLAADDALEVADDHREGVRADDGAEDVVGVLAGGHPVAHGFVGGILERARAGIDLDDAGAEHAHADDVQALAPGIFRAHVDIALEAEVRSGGGAGDAVLASAGLGDDALLAHASREQRLAEGVVDLVCAGVGEVLALEPQLGALPPTTPPPPPPCRTWAVSRPANCKGVGRPT